MDDVSKKELELLWNLVQEKFKSGNGVEVERISINKKEIQLIKEIAMKL